MKNILLLRNAGFTMIELLVVIAVIGVSCGRSVHNQSN